VQLFAYEKVSGMLVIQESKGESKGNVRFLKANSIKVRLRVLGPLPPQTPSRIRERRDRPASLLRS
jgi:hypothetical protein